MSDAEGREDAAFKRLVERMRSALAGYDKDLTSEERAVEETCTCPLCEFVRMNRKIVGEFPE
jgi:hypothetical protein